MGFGRPLFGSQQHFSFPGVEVELTETRGRLPVPGTMEGHVHVLGIGVERVPDWCAMRLETQTRGDGLGVAAGVIEGTVRAEDEVASRLEGLVVRESRRVPNSKACWVPVPSVSRLQWITD
jgi:hypothetical protein